MVSMWVIVYAFLVGGLLGMLTTALMVMAGREDERDAKGNNDLWSSKFG